MHYLKGIIEHIREEVEDVRNYAETATVARTDHPQLAALYAELGHEEMHHAERLHKMAVEMIERVRESGKEPPAYMKAIWDFEHEMMIEDMAEAKVLLDMFK